MNYIDVKIDKPLYGTFVYIRDKYLNQAKSSGWPLRITTPHGVGVMSYESFMRGAKKMEKVFLIPEKPMILYGNFIRMEENENTSGQ